MNPPRDRNSRRAAVTLTCAFLCLLLTPGACWLLQRPSLASLMQGLVFPLSLLLAFLAMFGRRTWLGIAILSPFAIMAPAEVGFTYSYRRPSDSNVLATIFESNLREAHDFLGAALWPLAAGCLLTILLSALTIITAYRAGLALRGRLRDYALLMFFLPAASVFLFGSLTPQATTSRLQAGLAELGSYGDVLAPGYPFGLILRIESYREDRLALQKQVDRLKGFRFHAHTDWQPAGRQIYVFVVGESSRRDHWSLFGYGRPTNPQLTHTENVIAIPNMITPWGASRMAIPVLLTRKSGADQRPFFDEASVIRAYSEAGFRTYWFSNQLAVGLHDSPVSQYAYEADFVRFFNIATWADRGNYDEILLPALKDVIEKGSGNAFVVLHTMGSHGEYRYRFPPAFDRFSEGTDTDDYTHQLDAYDASILYTDDFLSRVIAQLKSDDAVTAMFYVSDHGEDLPNASCKMFGHGNPSWNDFLIPALFWYSDNYQRASSIAVEQLRRNSDRALTTENMFESLLDMARITYPDQDRSHSMFSSDLRDRPRLVNAYGIVDIDHAQRGKNCPIVLP
jgi:glucan phosphoethanolaminetransferase (alkaline phosphatase superfamily)